jgi:uncharacterized protein
MRPSATTATLCFSLLALAPVPDARAEVELKGTPSELGRYLRPERQMLTLVGHAREVVQADVGKVVITVKTQAKDLAGALGANTERRAQIAQALQREGIDAKNIRSERFSSSPNFGWFGKQPASFEVTNRIEVKITDDRQLTAVARLSEPSGEVSVSDVTFEVTDQEKRIEKLRLQAFDDAVAKKASYESRLGVLLKPTAFRYSSSAPGAGSDSGSLEEIIVTARKTTASRASDAADMMETNPFEDQVIDIWATVTFEATPRAETLPK